MAWTSYRFLVRIKTAREAQHVLASKQGGWSPSSAPLRNPTSMNGLKMTWVPLCVARLHVSCQADLLCRVEGKA
jgi:hypothetical protein